MANIAITAASVVPGANAKTVDGIAGAAITAGQVVYLDPATGKLLLADADSATAAARSVLGIALNSAAIGQPVTVQKAGLITIGGTVAPGVGYYLSATAGAIAPVADMTTGLYPTLLGFGQSATVINLAITPAGVSV